MPEKKDPPPGLYRNVTSDPTLYSKRCPRCGSTEFEWVVREGHRIEVCERCGQVIETEQR